MPGLLFERGARFRVTRDLKTHALVGWKAPATTSEYCVLPAGTVLRLDDDAKEPESDVRYEWQGPTDGAPFIRTVFEAALELPGMGLKEDIERHPENWQRIEHVVYGVLSCHPENHQQLEPVLIPESTRMHPKYNGYWFVLALTEVGERMELMPLGPPLLLARGTRLYATESFEALGVTEDSVAVHCDVSAETVLVTQHDVAAPHRVPGWQFESGKRTQWMSKALLDAQGRDQPGGDGWCLTDRICPSHFLAVVASGQPTCDGESRLLLVRTDLFQLGTLSILPRS